MLHHLAKHIIDLFCPEMRTTKLSLMWSLRMRRKRMT